MNKATQNDSWVRNPDYVHKCGGDKKKYGRLTFHPEYKIGKGSR